MKVSIIIPTLENPEYLACLLDSINKHTVVDYEVLIYQDSMADHVGLPKAINSLGRQAVGEFIFYPNDDMYLAPGWDTALLAKVNPDIPYQYLTAAMFEPQYNNVCMNSPIPYGRNPTEFREQDFLDEWQDVRTIKQDIVSPYCPLFVTKKLWDEVGGYSEAFFPCFGTDPDFAAKIYFAAKTYDQPYEFRAVADCGVYHFQCITTDRIPNDAHHRVQAALTFNRKFNMTWGTFYKDILHIGEEL